MLFRPRYTIDTIYNLDPKQLNKMGIKAIFSDLDNTLLAWNKADTAVEMDQLNKKLAKAGIKLVVISNNNAERIGKVLNPYHIQFIAKARKPLPIGINKEPLVETDKWNTRINRFFEKFIFFFLGLKKPVTFKEKLEQNG